MILNNAKGHSVIEKLKDNLKLLSENYFDIFKKKHFILDLVILSTVFINKYLFIFLILEKILYINNILCKNEILNKKIFFINCYFALALTSVIFLVLKAKIFLIIWFLLIITLNRFVIFIIKNLLNKNIFFTYFFINIFSLLNSFLIGLIIKQNIKYFIFFNIVITNTIFLYGLIFNNWKKKYFLDNTNEEKYYIKCYNYLLLSSIILAIFNLTKLINV